MDAHSVQKRSNASLNLIASICGCLAMLEARTVSGAELSADQPADGPGGDKGGDKYTGGPEEELDLGGECLPRLFGGTPEVIHRGIG